MAQTNRMKFKGIPMEGPLDSFVQKLENQGLTFLGQKDGLAVLVGEFAGVLDCSIGVLSFSDRDEVKAVAVSFPQQENWNDITHLYNLLKQKLTQKYGTPECVEKFSGTEPITDFLKFRALMDGECEFSSKFTCEDGRVEMKMVKQDYNAAAVALTYVDKAHIDEIRKKVMDDL